MKLDKPRTEPDIYISYATQNATKKKYRDQFELKPQTAETPWVPSRFNRSDLLRAVSTRRVNLNPRLNYVSETSEQEPYVQFSNLGRFSPDEDYDLDIGRPNVENFPELQPDFDPTWNELYKLSPVIKPIDKIKNPFPRKDDVDPNGYLKQMLQENLTTEIPSLPKAIDETVQSGTKIS